MDNNNNNNNNNNRGKKINVPLHKNISKSILFYSLCVKFEHKVFSLRNLGVHFDSLIPITATLLDPYQCLVNINFWTHPLVHLLDIYI